MRKDTIESLRSTTGLSAKEIEEKIEQAKKLLDETGVPHFMCAIYVEVEGEEVKDNSLIVKCKGQAGAIIEALIRTAIADEKYEILFTDVADAITKMKESGILGMVREGNEYIKHTK